MLLQLELMCVKLASNLDKNEQNRPAACSLLWKLSAFSLPDEKLKVQSQKLPPSLFAEAVAQRKHFSSVWSQQ